MVRHWRRKPGIVGSIPASPTTEDEVNKICPNNGKVQYDSEEDAEYAIPRIEKKYGDAGRPYYCMYCDKWHLGRKKARTKKKRKRT